MIPITAPWPFAQWGIDIMRPLPIERKQYKFLIVAINYFTKWVEVEPTVTITEAKITSFVWKNIIYKFSIPNIIILDNSKLQTEACSKLSKFNSRGKRVLGQKSCLTFYGYTGWPYECQWEKHHFD